MQLIPLSRIPRTLRVTGSSVTAACLLIASASPATAAEPPAPVLLAAKRALQISFSTKPGERYQVSRSDHGTTWTPVGEVITGTGNEVVLNYLTEATASGQFRVETLSGQPVEVVKNLTDFKDYAQWRLVRTLLGPDPFLGGAHGGGTFFRAIYVSPADAKPVNGQFPAGTVFLKQLRTNQGGAPGEITDALTVMVKRGGAFSPEGNGWEYFMTDTALSQTLMRGGHETMCFSCHNAAKDLDFVFSTEALNP